MAYSTSGFEIASRKKNIASRLEKQALELQDVPTWKTLASVALPFAATLAMPWAGGLMMASGMPFLGGIGGALASSGGAMGAGGMLKGLLAKGAFSHLVKTGGREAMDAIEGKSEKDLNVGTDPLDIALGQEAQDKLRRDYRKAEQEEKQVDITGTIMSAIEAQGGLDAFKQAFETEGAIRAVKGAGSYEDLLKLKQDPKQLKLMKDFEKANPKRFKKIQDKLSQGFLPEPTGITPSISSAITPPHQAIDPNLLKIAAPGGTAHNQYPGVNLPQVQGGGQQAVQISGRSWIEELLESIKSGETYQAPSTPYYSGPGGK